MPTALCVGVIVASVAVAYGNSLRGAFVMDDAEIVAKNETIRPPWSWRVVRPMKGGTPVSGRPLVNVTLAVNYAIGGEAVREYHLVNVAIHALNALVLFGLVRRTLALVGRPGGTVTALAVAVLWAVHPLTTAAVDYVSQRTELMGSLFYLLTLYCAARSAQEEGGRRWRWGAVVACLLGVVCKEIIVTAPLMVMLFDRAFVCGSFVECWRRRRGLYVGLAMSWVPLAALMAYSGSRGESVGFGIEAHAWRYPLTQCRAVVLYLQRSVWPQPLVFDYGPYLVRSAADVAWQGVVVVALSVGAALLFLRRPRWGFFAVAWFLCLAPTSSVMPIWTQTIGEHRAYLPLAAFVAGMVMIVAGRMQRAGVAGGIVVLAIAAAMIGATRQRNLVYRSVAALWDDVCQHWGWNDRAFNGRGVARFERGAYREAIEDYTQAIRLRPAGATAYLNRGNAWLMLGEGRRALEDIDQAIRVGLGDVADAHYDRGNAHRATGDLSAAIEDYRASIQRNPAFAAAHANLGGTLWLAGRAPAALQAFDRAVELEPGNAAYRRNRGLIRAAIGDHRGAVDDADAAIRAEPNNPGHYDDRAVAHAALGDYDRAWADVRACRRLGGEPNAEWLRKLVQASGRSE